MAAFGEFAFQLEENRVFMDRTIRSQNNGIAVHIRRLHCITNAGAADDTSTKAHSQDGLLVTSCAPLIPRGIKRAQLLKFFLSDCFPSKVS